MSTPSLVDRDERTVVVENSGYKWAYGFLCFALLIDVAFRGIVYQEAAWDLMALVVLGGAFFTARQAYHQALPGGLVKSGMLIAGVAFLIALLTGAILAWSRN